MEKKRERSWRKTAGAVFAGLAGLGLCAALLGCATNKNVYQDIDNGVSGVKGSYESALAALEKGQQGKNPIYPEKNAVMLYLDKGVIEHYAGQYPGSSQDLEEAERLIREAYTKSVTQDIASYLANDNTKDYAGETYEDLYINVLNALNYYQNGDVEGAGVEVRKVTEKITALSDTVSGAKKKDGPTASEILAGITQIAKELGLSSIALPSPEAPHAAGTPVSDSALARYLSAIFYRGEGLLDDARIDLEKLRELGGGGFADEESNIPAGKARINVLGFAGLSPEKLQDIQDFSLMFFPVIATLAPVDTPKLRLTTGNLALPKLEDRPSVIDRVEVVINGKNQALTLIEDIGAVMKSTLDAQIDALYEKAYFQAAARYITVEVAGQKAVEKGAPAIAVQAAVAGAKKSADALAQADVRGGRYFPGKAYAGGVTVDPGHYTVTINYYAGGSVVASEIREIDAAAGKANVVEAVCLK